MLEKKVNGHQKSKVLCTCEFAVQPNPEATFLVM